MIWYVKHGLDGEDLYPAPPLSKSDQVPLVIPPICHLAADSCTVAHILPWLSPSDPLARRPPIEIHMWYDPCFVATASQWLPCQGCRLLMQSQFTRCTSSISACATLEFTRFSNVICDLSVIGLAHDCTAFRRHVPCINCWSALS